MTDKFKKIWAQMRASEFGPEPLIVELHENEILIQTYSSWGEEHQGLFCEGSGSTIEKALDNFENNLDQILQEENE